MTSGEDENRISDSDLVSLRTDARWKRMLAQIEKAEENRRRLLSDPNRSLFVTSDIPRFWSAYDAALGLPPEQRVAVFQKEYLDRATPGMKDWIRVRGVTSASLAQFITKNPRFFATIRPPTLGIEAQRPATIKAFRKLKLLYPAAQFPETTFCVGAFYGGGTVSQNNLLMSAEMYTSTPQTPMEELSRWQKTVLTPNSDLPFIIAHEAIHFQQRYLPLARTLLRACIEEGSVNFLSELCSGGVGQFHQKYVFPYGDTHERELWKRFQQNMDRTDRQKVWLYSESGEGKRPDDLGYYMGCKICESFYRQSADKKQAIHDILHITDFKAFLKASRYSEKFSAVTTQP